MDHDSYCDSLKWTDLAHNSETFVFTGELGCYLRCLESHKVFLERMTEVAGKFKEGLNTFCLVCYFLEEKLSLWDFRFSQQRV
jgi:hypothetical protein